LKGKVIVVDGEIEFFLDRRLQPFDVFAVQTGFEAALAAEKMVVGFHARDFEAPEFSASSRIHQMQFLEELQIPVDRRPVEGGRFFPEQENDVFDGHAVPGFTDNVQDGFSLRRDSVSSAADFLRVIQQVVGHNPSDSLMRLFAIRIISQIGG
jgi:hypothetical protein